MLVYLLDLLLRYDVVVLEYCYGYYYYLMTQFLLVFNYLRLLNQVRVVGLAYMVALISVLVLVLVVVDVFVLIYSISKFRYAVFLSLTGILQRFRKMVILQEIQFVDRIFVYVMCDI